MTPTHPCAEDVVVSGEWQTANDGSLSTAMICVTVRKRFRMTLLGTLLMLETEQYIGCGERMMLKKWSLWNDHCFGVFETLSCRVSSERRCAWMMRISALSHNRWTASSEVAHLLCKMVLETACRLELLPTLWAFSWLVNCLCRCGGGTVG